MKGTKCSGCGETTGYLVVRFCTPCLRDMVRIMKGKPA